MQRLIFTAFLLLLSALPAQTPEQPDPIPLLVAMGEKISRVQRYSASVERKASLEVEGTSHIASSRADFTFERPNLLTLHIEHPESSLRVHSDGESLTIGNPLSGESIIFTAPATLAEIDEATEGLATEGLAIASLYLSEEPVQDLIADFSEIHFIGRSEIGDRPCHVIGLDESANMGPRLLLYIDDEWGVPIHAILDASSVLRDSLLASNTDSRGAKVTVTETHRVQEIVFDEEPTTP